MLGRLHVIEKKIIIMASMVRAASWKIFNLEKDREGLGISTLFGTLVLPILFLT